MKKLLALGIFALLPFAVSAQSLEWNTGGYKKADIKNQLSERLISYTSSDTSTTSAQNKFAKQLAKELRALGVQNVKTGKNGVVVASIPANVKTDAPTLAFITQTAASTKQVKPQTHKNYTGGDIVLQTQPQVVLDKYNAPQLTRAYGHDLITTSGDTSLGAQGKAGAAVLLQAVKFLDEHPEVSHGTITFAFVPDGTKLTEADAKSLQADYLYTLDAEDRGELTDETFAIRLFTISFEGNRTAELGRAQQAGLGDNILAASDFHTLLPRHLRPETTSGRRGFIYVDSITHTGNQTKITGLVSAFSPEDINSLSGEVTRAFNTTKALYNNVRDFNLTWKDTAVNLRAHVPQKTITLAQNAMRAEDIPFVEIPARTENLAAQLIPFGLYAPALFTGHYNANTPLEYVDIDVLENSFRTVMRLITDATFSPVNK